MGAYKYRGADPGRDARIQANVTVARIAALRAALNGQGQAGHGTYSAYYHGCRCPDCRQYQSDRNARNRARQLASGRLTHGTRSAYDCGCRCDPCKQARREAYRRLEAGA